MGFRQGQICPNHPSQNEFRKRAVQVRNGECACRLGLRWQAQRTPLLHARKSFASVYFSSARKRRRRSRSVGAVQNRPSRNEYRKRVPVRLHQISVIAMLRAPSHATRCLCGIRNAVAADVSRLKFLPRRNNERIDIRCHVRICHCRVPKRQRAGALHDASRTPGRSAFPPGLGLRWPSTAFPRHHRAIRPSVSIRG